MKRLSILFILLLCGFAQAAEPIQLARMNPYVAGSVAAAGGACATSIDADTTGTQQGAFATSTTYGWAGAFLTSAAYAPCKVEVELARSGTPSGNIRAAFYASTGGASHAPTGSALCTSDNSYTQADLAVEGTKYVKAFNFTSCSALTTATIYFLYVYSDTLNESGYIYVSYNSTGGDNACGTGVTCRWYYNSGSWTAFDGSSDIYRTIYK